jgi:hypothetical protein
MFAGKAVKQAAVSHLPGAMAKAGLLGKNIGRPFCCLVRFRNDFVGELA